MNIENVSRHTNQLDQRMDELCQIINMELDGKANIQQTERMFEKLKVLIMKKIDAIVVSKKQQKVESDDSDTQIHQPKPISPCYFNIKPSSSFDKRQMEGLPQLGHRPYDIIYESSKNEVVKRFQTGLLSKRYDKY